MSLFNKYLGLLKSEQAKYAMESLQRPARRDEFEYGERCGHLAGLLRAEQLLLQLIEDDKNESRK